MAKDKKDPKATAFLISKDKYKDLQIYAEFWVSNDANSGIFIRCEDPKKPGAKTCYECNIFDTRPDPTMAPAPSSITPRSTRCPRPAASGAPWRSRPRAATFPSCSTARKRRASAAAYTPKDRCAAIRRGRGQVPQGRDQAVVIASANCLSISRSSREREARATCFVIRGGTEDVITGRWTPSAPPRRREDREAVDRRLLR